MEYAAGGVLSQLGACTILEYQDKNKNIKNIYTRISKLFVHLYCFTTLFRTCILFRSCNSCNSLDQKINKNFDGEGGIGEERSRNPGPRNAQEWQGEKGWGNRNWWYHLFWPISLTFQGHDLYKLIFWAVSPLLLGKALPVKEFKECYSFYQWPWLFKVMTFVGFYLFSYLWIGVHVLV